MTGSTALAAYADTFQGVTFTQDTDPDGEFVALCQEFWLGALWEHFCLWLHAVWLVMHHMG